MTAGEQPTGNTGEQGNDPNVCTRLVRSILKSGMITLDRLASNISQITRHIMESL